MPHELPRLWLDRINVALREDQHADRNSRTAVVAKDSDRVNDLRVVITALSQPVLEADARLYPFPRLARIRAACEREKLRLERAADTRVNRNGRGRPPHKLARSIAVCRDAVASGVSLDVVTSFLWQVSGHVNGYRPGEERVAPKAHAALSTPYSRLRDLIRKPARKKFGRKRLTR